MEDVSGDTDINNDSFDLPVFSFTGLRSKVCDDTVDFKHRSPGQSDSIVVEGSNSEHHDVPLAKTRRSKRIRSHSVKCLPKEIITVVSSESDGDDDLIIPLSDRLRAKLTGNQNVEKPDHSLSKFTQENSRHNSVLGISIPNNPQLNQVGPEMKKTDAILNESQATEPTFISQRALPSRSTWDISDSDDGHEVHMLQPTKSHEPVLNSAQLCVRNVPSSRKVTSDSFKQNVTEIEKTQQAALRKCQEREYQRAEKEKVRQQREVEKAMKKELAEIQKMLRPGECLKHMLVSIDPGLLQVEGGGQLLSTLQTMEVSCVIENQTIPHSVTWRRRQACVVGQQMNEKTDWVDELHVLIYIPLEEFVSMVHNYKQELQGAAIENQMTLQGFVLDILQKSASRVPCFVVVGLEKHFRLTKKHKSQQTKCSEERAKQRKAKSYNQHVPLISRADVELVSFHWLQRHGATLISQALVHLQLSIGAQLELLEEWKEFADYISMFTKAVAEAPFKRAQENKGLSVYLESDKSRGTKVDHSGKGLLSIWKKQIQQLNRVSSEMANAIVSAYQSPWLLAQAYQMCSSEQEKENLLADISVRRGEGAISTTRRIGPELSKRVYLLMTSTDADFFLE